LDLTGGAGGCLVAGLKNSRSVIYNDIDVKQSEFALKRLTDGKYKFLNIIVIILYNSYL
jgi:hypothetical protein